eukprot:scaffold132872_cov35-Tisochrysis_lutea.AAC.3
MGVLNASDWRANRTVGRAVRLQRLGRARMMEWQHSLQRPNTSPGASHGWCSRHREAHIMARGTVNERPTVAAAGDVSITALAHSVSERTLSAIPCDACRHQATSDIS